MLYAKDIIEIIRELEEGETNVPIESRNSPGFLEIANQYNQIQLMLVHLIRLAPYSWGQLQKEPDRLKHFTRRLSGVMQAIINRV